MISTTWLVAAGMAASSLHVGVARTAHDARVRGMVWLSFLSAIALASECAIGGTAAVTRTVVVADLLIAWTAIGLAGVATHSARALGLAMGLVSIAVAGLTSGPWGVVAALAASALIARGAIGGSGRSRFDGAQIFAVGAASAGVLSVETGDGSVATVAVACAVCARMGLVPCHGWLSDFVARTPGAIRVTFLAPVLPLWPSLLEGALAPGAVVSTTLVTLAILAASAGALVSLVRSDGRGALTLLWSGQAALVVFALALGTEAGRHAGTLLAAVLAVSMAGAWSVAGAVEARRGRLDLEGGGAAGVPRAAAAFLVLGMAGVGMPATPGFVAEDLVLHAAADLGILASAGLLGASALHGIALMRIYFGLFTGPHRRPAEPDLVPRERLCAGVALALLVLGGVWPGALLTAAAAAL